MRAGSPSPPPTTRHFIRAVGGGGLFCVAGCFVCLARSDCRLAALAARFGGVRGGWPGGRRARGDGRAGLVWSVVKSGQVAWAH